MFVSGLNNIYGARENEKVFGTKALKKSQKEEDTSLIKEADEESRGQREDSIEISLEGRLAAAGQDNEPQEPAVSDTEEKADEGVSGTEEEAGEGVSGTEEEAGEGVSGTEEEADESDSEKQSGKVAVNEGKRARQIAAAQSQAQVQQVLALLQKDLSDCKAGLEKGWCDESEVAKVEALMNKAKARMSQIPQESAQESSQGGLDAFAMASLM